jgi:hypothetical protein
MAQPSSVQACPLPDLPNLRIVSATIGTGAYATLVASPQ